MIILQQKVSQVLVLRMRCILINFICLGEQDKMVLHIIVDDLDQTFTFNSMFYFGMICILQNMLFLVSVHIFYHLSGGLMILLTHIKLMNFF